MFSAAHVGGLEPRYAERYEIDQSLCGDIFYHPDHYWLLCLVQSSCCHLGGRFYQPFGK